MKILKILAIILLIIGSYPIMKISESFWYAQTVDRELFAILVKNANKEPNNLNLLVLKKENSDFISKEGKFLNGNIRHKIVYVDTFNQEGIMIGRTDYIIETKNPSRSTWENFARMPCPSDYLYIYNEKLLYFCDKILIINQKGETEGNLLSGMKIRSIEQLIQIDRKIYIIQNDYRLKWTTPRSLASGERPGPYLVTAIEIDLDTLKYKEHIIGYDQYWSSSSYKSDVLR